MSLGEITNLIHQHPMLISVLNSVHDIALILDSERRIVYFNNQFKVFADTFGLKKEIGIKPGIAFNCIHALEERAECGETSFCRYCGGNKAINESRKGSKHVSECRIAAMSGHAFNLTVSAAPLEIDGHMLTLYCIVDSSSESRRQMLEKIFFHDINNIVNGMNLIMDLLQESRDNNDIDEFNKSLDMLKATMTSLKNEISSQHIISLAEKNELMVSPQNISAAELINEVVGFMENTYNDNSTDIQTNFSDDERIINTDPVLLKRVLINTLKNACEASAKGDKVIVGFKDISSSLLIYVNNPVVMTEKVRSSVFKRSFSTKGIGRGLGTYSMRLLTERYLKGKIYFTSEDGEGTTFFIKLPVSLSD